MENGTGKKSVKSRIVSAAWQLFYEKGYNGTTVDEIIELSGTSKGSFYYYFDTKDELLNTLSLVLDEYYEVLRGNSYGDIAANLGGVMSVTYSPSMIQTAIQDMVDYLNGETVEQDHVIECETVTPENVDQFPSFF